MSQKTIDLLDALLKSERLAALREAVALIDGWQETTNLRTNVVSLEPRAFGNTIGREYAAELERMIYDTENRK
jgi:hypothetical protein